LAIVNCQLLQTQKQKMLMIMMMTERCDQLCTNQNHTQHSAGIRFIVQDLYMRDKTLHSRRIVMFSFKLENLLKKI